MIHISILLDLGMHMVKIIVFIVFIFYFWRWENKILLIYSEIRNRRNENLQLLWNTSNIDVKIL